MALKPMLAQSQLEALAAALGDTELGLTNAEIEFLFTGSRMRDPGPMTKRHRIYNAFVEVQNRRQDRTNVLQFVRLAMDPARYVREPGRYEPMRSNVNRALAFAGLACTEAGRVVAVDAVETLPEAARRARELRSDLELRGVHPDVLVFCRTELVADDYFHAVQEAVKSIAAKMRDRTGLTDDGSSLVDRALGGEPPMLAINPLKTASQRSEQKGFANLVRGLFGMFRNPTAHEARIYWPMAKEDAEDLLTMVSMVHRRLDGAHMPLRS
jgi:uncharacterized protein (TIGR02391 family)